MEPGGAEFAHPAEMFEAARTSGNGPDPLSRETRSVEVELRTPADAASGPVTIPAYALYYVCEDVDGTCLYRRQDVSLQARVKPASP